MRAGLLSLGAGCRASPGRHCLERGRPFRGAQRLDDGQLARAVCEHHHPRQRPPPKHSAVAVARS